jgi:hypothetical protein
MRRHVGQEKAPDSYDSANTDVAEYDCESAPDRTVQEFELTKCNAEEHPNYGDPTCESINECALLDDPCSTWLSADNFDISEPWSNLNFKMSEAIQNSKLLNTQSL